MLLLLSSSSFGPLMLKKTSKKKTTLVHKMMWMRFLVIFNFFSTSTVLSILFYFLFYSISHIPSIPFDWKEGGTGTTLLEQPKLLALFFFFFLIHIYFFWKVPKVPFPQDLQSFNFKSSMLSFPIPSFCVRNTFFPSFCFRQSGHVV